MRLPPVPEIVALLQDGWSQSDVARRYGVTRQAVSGALALAKVSKEQRRRIVRHVELPEAPLRIRVEVRLPKRPQDGGGEGAPVDVEVELSDSDGGVPEEVADFGEGRP